MVILKFDPIKQLQDQRKNLDRQWENLLKTNPIDREILLNLMIQYNSIDKQLIDERQRKVKPVWYIFGERKYGL